MRTAKDGKPFDIDNLIGQRPDEVEVIQFLRPDGKRRRVTVTVGREIAKQAENMVLSAEELGTGDVVVYARFIGEGVERGTSELAVNGPGDKSPTACLKRLIEKKFKERRSE